jgi:uncharacterized protein YjbJ (UPF0337 family)
MSEIQNRIEGASEEAKGKVQQAASEATGDTKMNIEGKATELKGEVKQAVGKAEGRVEGLGERLKAKVSHLMGTDKPKTP